MWGGEGVIEISKLEIKMQLSIIIYGKNFKRPRIKNLDEEETFKSENL